MNTSRFGWLIGVGLVLLSGVLLAPGNALAQSDLRIGYINSETILQEYEAVRAAQAVYRQDIDAWNREATARKKDIEQLQRELEQQGPMLSDEKLREKEQDYQSKVAEYDGFIQSIWGPNGRVVQRNEEILRPIIQRIQDILSEIGADEGYHLILDAADGNILYADPDLDLTQRVLDLLNVQTGTETSTN